MDDKNSQRFTYIFLLVLGLGIVLQQVYFERQGQAQEQCFSQRLEEFDAVSKKRAALATKDSMIKTEVITAVAKAKNQKQIAQAFETFIRDQAKADERRARLAPPALSGGCGNNSEKVEEISEPPTSSGSGTEIFGVPAGDMTLMETIVKSLLIAIGCFVIGVSIIVSLRFMRYTWYKGRPGFMPIHVWTVAISYDLLLVLVISRRIQVIAVDDSLWRWITFAVAVILGAVAMIIVAIYHPRAHSSEKQRHLRDLQRRDERSDPIQTDVELAEHEKKE